MFVTPGSRAGRKRSTSSGGGGSSFPSGTLMLFQQTAAPTGWTKQTTHNDKALRVVSGTASSGGTTAFSTVFGQSATGATTLTTSQVPHASYSTSTSVNSTFHNFGSGGDGAGDYPAIFTDTSSGVSTGSSSTNRSDTNVVVTSSASSSTSDSNGGGSHTHTISLQVQYVDLIIAQKN